MKKKKFQSKLTLKKEQIANLNVIKGGGIGEQCTVVENSCIPKECHIQMNTDITECICS